MTSVALHQATIENNIDVNSGSLQVYKFGGSSLATAKCYKKVARIIKHNLTHQDWVVVSASGQTTDWLTTISNNHYSATDSLNKIQYHQTALIQSCLEENATQQELLKDLQNDLKWLAYLISQNITVSLQNDILAFGEIWSAKLLDALLTQEYINSSWLDARLFLTVNNAPHSDTIDFESSHKRLLRHARSRAQRLTIVTGFIASDCEGRSATLGRNGSDYSATLLARLLGAEQVTIWTDVAGIYQFDPNLYVNASTINQLSYELATELAQLGSPVLHRKTLSPIVNEPIQLKVRSTFSPEKKGTAIGAEKNEFQESIVTHTNSLHSLYIKYSDELSKQKAFNQLLELTQTSDHEFLLNLKHEQENILHLLVAEPSRSFWLSKINQYENGQLLDSTPCALLALVSKNIERKVFHKDFLSVFLASKTSINYSVHHLPNAILAVIDKYQIDDLATDCFQQWQDYCDQTALFLLGVGNVGSTWQQQFTQLKSQQPHVAQANLSITANSSKIFCLNRNGEVFSQQNNTPLELLNLTRNAPFKHKIIIDATADSSISSHYNDWLLSGAHIVSANKISSSSEQTNYTRLSKLANDNKVLWQQNATIGAGLPVNHALKDLLACGDQVIHIRGIFSGTLSWLMKSYDGQSKLSELILKAKSLGYTEPDPRADLTGLDAARKLVIAARLAGYSINIEDIILEPLIAEHFLAGTEQDFWQHAAAFDQEFHARWEHAQSREQSLVYETYFAPNQSAYAKIVAVDKNDALAQITPCDNIFEIKTQWYNQNPLIIRGPGAGKEVTAAAIQSDINHILQSILKETTQ